jgi:peptidoglycan/LPS O-acetylase OafA/YrhL
LGRARRIFPALFAAAAAMALVSPFTPKPAQEKLALFSNWRMQSSPRARRHKKISMPRP